MDVRRADAVRVSCEGGQEVPRGVMLDPTTRQTQAVGHQPSHGHQQG